MVERRSPLPIEQCLSVVMPAYNESATIAEIIAQVLESPFTAELVVV
ncbi:MAG: glycosyltransferase family 2 protein, partial [Actinobacteria bacterium]|nr:glycosyltransferase family 2 protein [Actinomycetota bacterium]